MTDRELVEALLGNPHISNVAITDRAAARLQALAARVKVLEAENERLRLDNRRLRLDKGTLLEFARAIKTWREDADSHDEECDHPKRDYCEDVELMEKAAGYALRRVAERAALGETK